MLYALLCYDSEEVVGAWTKEALLGFFIVDCESLEEAIATAKELGQASSSNGCYEIRPLSVFRPGSAGS